MRLVAGFAFSSVEVVRAVFGIVLVSVGLVLALVSPIFAFRPYRPGGRPLPNARRIRRLFVLTYELVACMCLAIGVNRIMPDTFVGDALLGVAGLSSFSSIFVFLAAHRLESRSAAAARARSSDEESR